MKTARNENQSSIRVIGSGEAFDTDLGNTSYLLRGEGHPTVLFDCGYQIPERLWKDGLHTSIDVICFTHLHADHSFGIVPLLVRYWEEKRTSPLRIIGPTGAQSFVQKLLGMGYPAIESKLEFSIEHLNLDPESSLSLSDLEFSCAPTVHSVLNYTIRVDRRDLAPFSFAVSGDGQITTATKSLASDVDVLFQEIYGLKPEISVHADFETVSAWIATSNVKKIVTSHFSRVAKSRLSEVVESTENSGTQWIVSRPGLEIAL